MAANLYATLDDINAHLPVEQGKAQITDSEDDLLQIDAQRLINGRLSGTFDITVINAWVSPATTPPQIRRIAGMLIAAKWYAMLVAEDEPDGSAFAQGLYNTAIAELNDIRNGTLTVIGVDGAELENSALIEASFWPNDTSPDPSFTIEETWA
mgnify:FL=1